MLKFCALVTIISFVFCSLRSAVLTHLRLMQVIIISLDKEVTNCPLCIVIPFHLLSSVLAVKSSVRNILTIFGSSHHSHSRNFLWSFIHPVLALFSIFFAFKIIISHLHRCFLARTLPLSFEVGFKLAAKVTCAPSHLRVGYLAP